MAKLTLSTIGSRYASVAALNANFAAIAAALENTLSRDGSVPNTMSANLDMNGYSILNAQNINIDQTDLVTYIDNLFDEQVDLAEAAAVSAQADAATATAAIASVSADAANASASATLAQEWAVSPSIVDATDYSSKYYATEAQSQAVAAAASAASAQAYSTLGLSVSGAFDFGYVTDVNNFFPTDFGSVA